MDNWNSEQLVLRWEIPDYSLLNNKISPLRAECSIREMRRFNYYKFHKRKGFQYLNYLKKETLNFELET